MTIIGILMVRDESDVLDPLIGHMLREGVDRLVIADNLSKDDTPEILHRWEQTGPVEVREDKVLAYTQDQKMTALAHSCGAEPGDWVLPFDADEWWYCTAGTLGEVLPQVPAEILKVWGWNHFPHPADDPTETNPFARMQWREADTQKLPKVWFRYHPDATLHMGNHDVDMPGRREEGIGLIEFRHMGIRSLEQFIRKGRNGAEAYAASTVNPTHGSHWRQWGTMTDNELAAEYDRFCSLATVHDPCPM